MEEAVYGDCCLLISNFVQNEKPSFESFCSEWKKLRFQHIFTAQTSYIELQQTAAAAFHVGKRLMCNRRATAESTDDFTYFDVSNEKSKILIRIGGLYLLYAIYFKQPLERYTKIEVSPKTWNEMKKFIRETLPSDVADYDEARFVFWKLYQSQAFRFTALDYCVGLENLVDFDNLDKSAANSAMKTCVSTSVVIEKLSSFAEVKHTAPALVALEGEYNEMKSTLTKMHKLDGQLLPPINIFQNIRDCFDNIEKILHNSDETEECSSDRQKSQKRSLKDKAFAAKKSNISSKTCEAQPKKHPKRMSARTIFAEKLPTDFVADLKEEIRDEVENDANVDSVQTKMAQDSETMTNDDMAAEVSLDEERVTIACRELLDDL